MRINNFSNPGLISGIIESLGVSNKTDSIKHDKQGEEKKEALLNEILDWRGNDVISPNKNPKWSLEKIPLKYFVESGNGDEKFLFGFVDAAKSAFQPWSRASYGLIRFQETLNKNNADIIVGWSNIITFGRDHEAGHSDLKIAGNKIQKAEITIIIYPIIDRTALNPGRIERVRRTSLHEIGHALGLNHSNSSKDLMFHRGINNKTLSSNDIRRLNELYSFKNPDIIT